MKCIETRGRTFCISMKVLEDPRQYVIYVDDVEVLHTPRARGLIANTTVERTVRYIAKKACANENGKFDRICTSETSEKIRGRVREVLTELYKRITVKRPEVPTDLKVVYVRPPYFHVEEVGVSCALSYEMSAGEKGIKYIPYLVCVDKDGDISTYKMFDALQTGIKFDSVIAFPFSVALKSILAEAEALDELEDMLSSWMEGGLTMAVIGGVPTVPTRARLEKYLNIVRRDPEGWARGTAQFIKSNIFRLTWRLLPTSQKAVMVGTVLAASVFPLLPYTTKVVFHSANPGSGKSYHIGIVSSFISYNLIINMGSGPGIERSVDFVIAVSIDDIPQREEARRELADLLIRGFKRDSKRVITAPDRISPMAIGGGPIVFIPDLAYQLLGLSDAATSRAVTISVATDPRFVEIKPPEDVIVKEVLRNARVVNLNTGEVLTLSGPEDWYAFFTAVGLFMWRKFAEELERLRAELKERPKVVGRYAQTYAAVVAALRAYGLSDLADKVLSMLESRERRDETLEIFAITVSSIWDDIVAKRLSEEIYIKMFQLSDGSDVVFAPLTSVVRYAASRMVAMSGDVPQVTDRVKLEESSNASFRTIEHWMRRTIPQELRNDKNLLSYLQGHPALKLLLFKVKNPYGHPVWSVAVTEHVVKALSILTSINDIEVAMSVFCATRRKICDEVDMPQKEHVCRAEECVEMLQQQEQPKTESPPADTQQRQETTQEQQQVHLPDKQTVPSQQQALAEEPQASEPEQQRESQQQGQTETRAESSGQQQTASAQSQPEQEFTLKKSGGAEKMSIDEVLRVIRDMLKKHGYV
jgi:hypothetical protein